MARRRAAVSGPGKLARRTDLAPSQPIRPIPAGQQGERAEFIAQQQAAPLAGGSPVATPRAVPFQAAQGGAAPSVFGPTQRPTEPITAGLDTGAGPGPAAEPIDAMEVLRAMIAVNPDPYLLRLLNG